MNIIHVVWRTMTVVLWEILVHDCGAYMCVEAYHRARDCLNDYCLCMQKQRSQWNDIIKTIYLHGVEHNLRKTVRKTLWT